MTAETNISASFCTRFYIPVMGMLLVFVLLQSSFAQTIKAAPIYEPQNPSRLSHPDIDRWSYLPDGLQVSFGNIDTRYDRDVVPMFSHTYEWTGVAWRGERINLQIVLWTSKSAGQVKLDAGALKNAEGEMIRPENIRTRFVRYVLSDNYFYGCKPNTEKEKPVLVADILDNIRTFNMPAHSTRPVWVTIDIPPAISPGLYDGKITVSTAGEKKQYMDLRVNVLPLRLPFPAEWEFELDLWQNPWAVARYHDVPPWSEAHIMLLKPLLKMLADAGQKYVTTSIIHHPWNAQTYDPYQSMIEWIREADGRWRFDYTIFDKWVDLCSSCGIDKYISCYSMLSFRNNNFRFYDSASGRYDFVYAEPGTQAYIRHWQPFLKDFAAHLESRGWLDKTAIAMDERPYELMKEIIALIHEASPSLKINLASEDWQEDLQKEIFSYSVSLGRYTNPEIVKERRRNGLISTFYPCCVEPRPNNYPHSDPAESAWMGWMAAADGFSGILRWAYNSWVEQPLTDARYSQWNSGETFLIYPGPRSSIRFERLRDGIQDYEKIRIVKEKLSALSNDEAKALLMELNGLLDNYSYQNAQNESITGQVNESKHLLEKISGYLTGR